MKHPIGTRVRICKDSKFYGQSFADGTVIGYEIQNWHNVRFDGGYENAYRYQDLVVVEPKDNEEALALLPLFE